MTITEEEFDKVVTGLFIQINLLARKAGELTDALETSRELNDRLRDSLRSLEAKIDEQHAKGICRKIKIMKYIIECNIPEYSTPREFQTWIEDALESYKQVRDYKEVGDMKQIEFIITKEPSHS